MWVTSLLPIMLLFPLLSAAPLDIAGGVEDDNDGLHGHENVTRRGKHFSNNKFDFSVDVQGDVGWISHDVNIDVHGHTDDHHHHEDDTVIECKKELRVLFKSIDSNNNGIIDAKELLRVCHQNNFQITESSAVRILTLPDKTVGFNLAKFCELLKDCPSTNREDLIYFLLELYDKVTCPHKDDLSDVLLENHWRTHNQINAMSENLQRNTVIVEVEKMTGHTIEDLQERANAGDLGSLTAIANMAGLLIKDSIMSSSDVETMEYSDLRNTLIVEASQQFSMKVSVLQSMTDRQLLKTFCTVRRGCERLEGKLLNVPCEDGWVVMQKRGQFKYKENFYRNFAEYEKGFGKIGAEFWLGLDNLAVLTAEGTWQLRVDLTDWDEQKYFSRYGSFRVGPGPLYVLRVSGYDEKSNGGDSLTNPKEPEWAHDGMAFTTFDRDEDTVTSNNCAVLKQGGWWYSDCYQSNLNGINYGEKRSDNTGITWEFGGERGDYTIATLKEATMKIRRIPDPIESTTLPV